MASRGLETIVSRSLLSKAALCSAKLEKISSKRMIGLLGLTEDRNSSFQRGASNAPSLIRQHFLMPSVNSWCELGVDLHDRIIDYGDIQPEERHHRDIYNAIRCKMDEIQRIDGLVPLTLGGDHSITFSTCSAVRNFVGKPLVIVHFDAHPDIYENFEDNPSSHASPFARICEVPGLCKKLIQIGIRTLSGEQMPQIAKYRVEVVEARNFPAKGSDIREILEKFIISDEDPVYISVDIDVLEPVTKTFVLLPLDDLQICLPQYCSSF